MAFFEWIFSSTKRTLVLCGVFLFFSLIFHGSLFDFYELKKQEQRVDEELASIQIKSEKLKKDLEKVNDPKFIEMQIKERFDFTDEGDLVFIFSDGE